MSALEERQLEQALAFALDQKRDNFITDHWLAERPAFVWQCLPVEPCRVDVSAEKVRCAVLGGVGDGTVSNDGWWFGFRSSNGARPVFDGLASTSGSDDSGWTAAPIVKMGWPDAYGEACGLEGAFVVAV